jgi:hypothetical protein
MAANQDTLSELNQQVVRMYLPGKYKKALHIACQSVLLAQETSGEDHPDYVQSLDSLAGLYCSMEAFEKAGPLCMQALQIRQKA